MYVYYAYLGDLRLMLIRNVYLVQIIFVAVIAAVSGDKNVLTAIKLLESGAHVTSISQEEKNGA